MLYFLDTEFMEDGFNSPIELISIGIVAEDGREFYGQLVEADYDHANQWVRQNVLPNLSSCPRREDKDYHNNSFSRDLKWAGICSAECPWTYREFMKRDILNFCSVGTRPEFWGYYADYDWVMFCQIFGTMMDLPKDWPMHCKDLKQWMDMYGLQKPEHTGTEHNALDDARWNRDLYYTIKNMIHPKMSSVTHVYKEDTT